MFCSFVSPGFLSKSKELVGCCWEIRLLGSLFLNWVRFGFIVCPCFGGFHGFFAQVCVRIHNPPSKKDNRTQHAVRFALTPLLTQQLKNYEKLNRNTLENVKTKNQTPPKPYVFVRLGVTRITPTVSASAGGSPIASGLSSGCPSSGVALKARAYSKMRYLQRYTPLFSWFCELLVIFVRLTILFF